VELALILPVLLVAALGCTDLGRFAYSYIAVVNAARAGAGYGMMNTYTPATQSTWTANVQQAAVDEMSGQTGFNSSNLSSTVTTVDEGSGDTRILVTSSYTFNTIISWPGIPSSLTLKWTAATRKIR
jgi:Flp pilus assembly protein TadG